MKKRWYLFLIIILIILITIKLVFASIFSDFFNSITGKTIFYSKDKYYCEKKIKIMFLGDSITSLYYKDKPNYREIIWTKLNKSRYNIDFVGSKKDSNFSLNYDKDHEGHSGWRADQILNGNIYAPYERNISNWSKTYNPNIVIIHIGINDYHYSEQNKIPWNETLKSTIEDISGIINVLRENNPNITIFLAQISGSKFGVPDKEIKKFNSELKNNFIHENNSKSTIIFVDLYNSFDLLKNGDGVHPNPEAAKKIADKWYIALKLFLDEKYPELCYKEV